MKRSTKTTLAGAFAGLGALFSLFANLLSEGGGGLGALLEPANSAALVSGIGAVFLGLFARDDNVTSEGEVAPKNIPE